MNKNVLIIEDQKKQLDILENIVRSIDTHIQIYTAGNAEAAYRIAMEVTIDVFLIDIILDISISGDTSGIRLARKVREVPKYRFTPMVFITSLEDPEIYAYKNIRCFGYIEKPFDAEYVKELTKQALLYSTDKDINNTLFFRKDGILYPVETMELICVESINHSLYISIKDKGMLNIPYKSCRRLLQEADVDYLFQCSRNTIVNRKHINTIDLTNRYIVLSGNKRVDIGITYLKKIKEEFGL